MTIVYLSLLLLATSLLLLAPLPAAYAQILGGGHCRLTRIHVQVGGSVCERLCFQRGYRGPPFVCRRYPGIRAATVPVCGNGCCRSGPNCLQLLRT